MHCALEYYLELGAAAAEAFRFLHVSTDEVYGSLGDAGKFTEETPYDPHSPYSASKAGADHLVRAWFDTYGLPTLITNCSNNFGPFQFPEKLIPVAIINSLRGKMIPIYGEGKNVRDWIFVEDHCKALLTVLESGRRGQTYNIGGNNERQNLDLVREVCRILDELRPRNDGSCHDELITFVSDRPGHDLRYAIDSTKISNELGWRPRRGLEWALSETVQWYLDNETWWTQLLSDPYKAGRDNAARIDP